MDTTISNLIKEYHSSEEHYLNGRYSVGEFATVRKGYIRKLNRIYREAQWPIKSSRSFKRN